MVTHRKFQNNLGLKLPTLKYRIIKIINKKNKNPKSPLLKRGVSPQIKKMLSNLKKGICY